MTNGSFTQTFSTRMGTLERPVLLAFSVIIAGFCVHSLGVLGTCYG